MYSISVLGNGSDIKMNMYGTLLQLVDRISFTGKKGDNSDLAYKEMT